MRTPFATQSWEFNTPLAPVYGQEAAKDPKGGAALGLGVADQPVVPREVAAGAGHHDVGD